jgi:hypothetical protein
MIIIYLIEIIHQFNIMCIRMEIKDMLLNHGHVIKLSSNKSFQNLDKNYIAYNIAGSIYFKQLTCNNHPKHSQLG